VLSFAFTLLSKVPTHTLRYTWYSRTSPKAMHDFIDVEEPEKVFFLLWNKFVQSDTVIPRKSLPRICYDFVETHAEKLHEANLREQLMFHMSNMWDEGLVSDDHILSCMHLYNLKCKK
jgi:hypothetical protein